MILLTSASTVLVGVFVFVAGQLIAKFVIEPVHELRKAIGETRFNLLFYAPAILTPIGRTRESADRARDALRKSSADLLIRSEAIPFYGLVSAISRGAVPQRHKVAEAATWLRGLSTHMHETGDEASSNIQQVAGDVQRIEANLGLSSLHES